MLDRILTEIDAEIARLQQVRALLVAAATPAKRGPGRPAETTDATAPKKAPRRTMSTAAREKMRQGQLRRWAATKKSAKNATK